MWVNSNVCGAVARMCRQHAMLTLVVLSAVLVLAAPLNAGAVSHSGQYSATGVAAALRAEGITVVVLGRGVHPTGTGSSEEALTLRLLDLPAHPHVVAVVADKSQSGGTWAIGGSLQAWVMDSTQAAATFHAQLHAQSRKSVLHRNVVVTVSARLRTACEAAFARLH